MVALVLRDTAAGGVVLILGQSLFQFRKSEERQSKLFFYSSTLAALVVFLAFWTTCFG